MKINTSIHSLARPGEKSGKITFICFTDGKEKTYYTCVNDLTGSRMSWFDGAPPVVDESLAFIRSVFAGIRKKATKVISSEGDF